MSGGGKPSPAVVQRILRRYHAPRVKYGTHKIFFRECGSKKVALRTNGDENGRMELLTIEELFTHFKDRLHDERDHTAVTTEEDT
jgi:hypothetical protein